MFNVTTIDAKKMVKELIMCETEECVINKLVEYGYWNDPDCWRDYGDNENNFSIIGNQQNSPDAALVEKIINSIDAVLMKESLEKGISPTSPSAPKSVYSAVEDFFDVPEGKLSNISTSERRSLAENVKFIATGRRTSPNYIIADKGEGQTPRNLPDTILSLSKSNKLRIPFVQGKFNMGGSGVLQFCGKNNLQLVLSKRSPNIMSDDPTKDYWGFTIVRRVPPSAGTRSSVYNYLAPDNEIISFKSEELNILPGADGAYEQPMRYGTFIKLYEYNIPGMRTNVLFDLYNRLSMLMPSIALPLRMYERRDYEGHSLETTLSGLNVRVEEDKRENIEDEFPLSSTITMNGQTLNVSIIVFKPGQEKKYTANEGVIFLINGQTHGSLGKTFFRRNKVGMGAIADSLLLIIDCSQMEAEQREDLFMNSRDRLREGETKRELEKELENMISSHPALRKLREQRRRDLLDNKLKDDKPLADVIENVMKSSPTLSQLFISGQRLSSPFNLRQVDTGEKIIGKRYPSYFNLSNKARNHNRNVPINVRTRITFETDAENYYFDRDSDRGSNKLYRDGKIEDASLNLYNGIATLNVQLPKDSKVGDQYNYQLLVTDPSRVKPFKEKFTLNVVDPKNKRKTGTGGPRIQPPGDGKGNKRKNNDMLAMPEVFELNENDWEKYNFTEHSSLRVDSNGEGGYDFFINMDNIHLLTELKSSHTENSNLIKSQYKYAMVLVGLGILNHIENNESAEKALDEIEKITQMISPLILPIINNLGDLEIN